MAKKVKIYAPNKEYNGISASVPFVNGVGETDDHHLIEWFRNNGYKVEGFDQEAKDSDGGKSEGPTMTAVKANSKKEKPLDQMSASELRDLAREKDVKGASSMNRDQLLKALKRS